MVGTANLALSYSRAGGNERLVGFCDADFAGDIVTRRSTTGFAFVWAGAAITWKSKLQPTVAVSTTEAELKAASEAGRDALWLKQLVPAIWGDKSSPDTIDGSAGTNQWPSDAAAPVAIFTDSQSALALVNNPMMTQRSKHIDVIHHFARERVARGEIAFAFVGTAANVADCLTKAVPANKLVFCRTGMGLV